MKKLKYLCLLLSAVMLTACSGAPAQTPSDTKDTNTSASEGTQEQEQTDGAETADSPQETEGEQEGGNKEVKPIVYDIDPSKPVIALTFDDGPNTTTTNQVLDLLDKYQVRASFFLIGDNINDESAKSVKRAYDMGCEINNHSKTHSYMNKMEDADIKAEVQYVNDKIVEITGESAKFFRPPYIAVNNAMYDCIDMPFINGIGCNDWDSSVEVETRLKKLNRQMKDGVIILLHDVQGNDKTVELLDILIPQLLEEGYQFATVSELFEAKGVEIRGDDTGLYSQVQKAE